MAQIFEYPNLLTGSRSGARWTYQNGNIDERHHHYLINKTNKENFIMSPLIPLKHGITYALSVYTANTENCAGSDIFVLHEKVVTGWIAAGVVNCEKGPRGGWITLVFALPDASPEGNYYIRFDNNGSTDGKDAIIWFDSPMLCAASEPHAWAPAEGEILIGGGTLMSANLWDASTANRKPNADGVYLSGTGGELVCNLASTSSLAENQTVHMGASLRGADKGELRPYVAYKDAAGKYNWVGFPDWTPTGQWQRFEGSCVVPSGMTIAAFGFNKSGATGDIEVYNPVFSYGSPIVLAISEITATDVKDGKSPTVSVSKSGTVTTIVVTNADGSKTTQTVKDGVNGTPGAKGADGRTLYFHVKYSNDGGKTFTASSGETVGTYIGTCTDFNSADPTSVGSYTWAKIKGETGATGPQGVGAKSIVPQYYLSTSNTAQSGGSWVESCPAWTSGHYIWTRSKITWTNNTTTYTTPQLDAAMNTANEKASTAKTLANSASDTANSAKATADTANVAAGQAQFNAASAKEAADNAQAAADAAKITADNAQSTADTAQKTADSASTAAQTAQKGVNTLYENIHITGDGMYLSKVDSEGNYHGYRTLVSDQGMRVAQVSDGEVTLKAEGDTVEAVNLVSRETLSVNADGYKLQWMKFHSSVDNEDGIGAYWSKT